MELNIKEWKNIEEMMFVGICLLVTFSEYSTDVSAVLGFQVTRL